MIYCSCLSSSLVPLGLDLRLKTYLYLLQRRGVGMFYAYSSRMEGYPDVMIEDYADITLEFIIDGN
jgi:hypothetical protein